MEDCFSGAKKNFGFGCMRLPMSFGKVNTAEFSQMIDAFLANGFNYFDTAHGYLRGESEKAIAECLAARYPRTSYILANKLTGDYFHKREDIRPFFASQLALCGVEYFDYYLMHAQTADIYKKFVACNAYETAFELKKEGKIKHVGLSFHDNASVLDKILTEKPDIEFVQIQFNYVDYDSVSVQSKLCYDVCRKHNKPIIVMEPVKGGSLVNLPSEARTVFTALNGGSFASYAIRYAASFDGVKMVLSGMSNMAELNDNVSFMSEFKPLAKEEFLAIDKVRGIFKSKNLIPCTACRYCIEGCPKNIAIPDLLACLNAKKLWKDENIIQYHNAHTNNSGKAADCIKCGKCENACPQHLKIRKLLQKVARKFER